MTTERRHGHTYTCKEADEAIVIQARQIEELRRALRDIQAEADYIDFVPIWSDKLDAIWDRAAKALER